MANNTPKNELYQRFFIENALHMNRGLNKILWVSVFVGPVIALGQFVGLYHGVSYAACFICAAVTLAFTLLQYVVTKKRKLTLPGKYISLVVIEGIVVYMGLSHMYLPVAFFLLPFLSILYCDELTYVIASVIAYCGTLITAHVTADYYVATSAEFSDVRSWFAEQVFSFSVQHIVFFVAGYIMVKALKNSIRSNMEFRIKSENTKLEMVAQKAMHAALEEDSPESALNTLLEHLGEAFNADRMYIFEDDVDRGITVNTYEWVKPGVKPAITSMSLVYKEDFRVLYEYFERGENVIISDAKEFESASLELRRLLEEQGTLSLVASPIYEQGNLIGFYGVDNSTGVDLANTAAILSIIGDFLYSLIRFRNTVSKHEEEAMISSYASFSKIYNTVALMDLKEDTFKIVHCHDAVRQVLNQNPDNKSANVAVHAVMNAVATGQGKEQILEFVDLDTVRDRMGTGASLECEFIGIASGYCRARIIRSDSDEDGLPTKIIFTVEVIDEAKRKENELRYLSETDLMTGIRNRGSGEAKIKQLIRDKEYGALFILDVDKFKQINDSFGHAVGDKVLIEVAAAVQKAFRHHDVVMRMGGDEFAAYAIGMTNKLKAIELSNRLFDIIKEIDIPELGEGKINVSVGIIIFDADNDIASFDELYKKADQGLYESKKISGNWATFA